MIFIYYDKPLQNVALAKFLDLKILEIFMLVKSLLEILFRNLLHRILSLRSLLICQNSLK